MRNRGTGALAAVLVIVLTSALSCDRAEAPRQGPGTLDENAALGGEVAARVGVQAIPLSLVQSVADAQRITAQEAVRKVVDDEITAAAAVANGLDREQPAAWLLVSARARFASDRLFAEAKKKAPPTDDELKILSAKHWVEVDRPPTVDVIHAIVIRPKATSLIAPARALADNLRAAVLPAQDRDDFKRRAEAQPHDPKLEVKIESLPPFTVEGWPTQGSGQMDLTFAKASFALPRPGETSPVVETTFGWHVIRLVEAVPERRMPIEARRLAFAAEVYSLRTRDLLQERMKALGAKHEINVSSTAEALMRSVSVAPEAPAIP